MGVVAAIVATVAIVGAAVATGVAVAQEQKAFEAEAEAAEAQAEYAEETTVSRAEREEEVYRERGEYALGATRAAYGTSGVRTTEGSALQELQRRRERLETDIDYIQETAARDVEYIRRGAELQQQGIEASRKAALWGGIANIFGQVGQMAGGFTGMSWGGGGGGTMGGGAAMGGAMGVGSFLGTPSAGGTVGASPMVPAMPYAGVY